MKCDELKAHTLFTTSSLSGQRVYLTNDVDAAIAELKEKLHDAEMRADLAVAAETERRIDYDNLKKKHRQTLHALYKACANWAHFAVAFFSSYVIKNRWHKMERICRAKAEEYKNEKV